MDNYVKLAHDAIKEIINNHKTLELPKDLPKEMLTKKAGVFVSIHKKPTATLRVTATGEGELRGCIGTFLPTKKNIALEIIDNAVSAATHDYRFKPITSEELPDLEISVDELEEPEPVQGLTSLDAKKYGVIVKSENGRTGLLLPDLEGVNTPEQQIAIARQKASISPNEPIYLYRFMVTRHKNSI